MKKEEEERKQKKGQQGMRLRSLLVRRLQTRERRSTKIRIQKKMIYWIIKRSIKKRCQEEEEEEEFDQKTKKMIEEEHKIWKKRRRRIDPMGDVFVQEAKMLDPNARLQNEESFIEYLPSFLSVQYIKCVMLPATNEICMENEMK